MKFVTVLLSALSAPRSGGSVRAVVRLVAILLASVLVFSVGFQVLMELEGQEHSWPSAVYWTVVTMTTLGFGDIVFESDLGRMYSVVVLLAGAVLILVLLPFTFIQLVYLPFRAAAQEARAPRRLPDHVSGHILVTGRSPMEELLMHRAATAGVPYALIVEDVDEAVSLHDAGYDVLVGRLDDPETYRAGRAAQAALIVTARSDQANTNVAFTVREVTDRSTVVVTATSPDSVDVLELAGADHVVQLGQLLGEGFARRILAPTARSSIISSFSDLVIAETSAAGTELVGRSLGELDLRERFGVSVIGRWDRGSLELATPGSVVEETSILLLAGTEDALAAYDEAYAPDEARGDDGLVVILGGGRVGRATAAALEAAGTPYRIVETREERVAHLEHAVVGDAADLGTLREAGIDRAAAVVVTTHDDDTNIYLTLYCRKLRPDIEILGRVDSDRNLTTMHRAGADLALSYASTGAIEAWNARREDTTLLLAEGLVVFRVPTPQKLVGQRLDRSGLAESIGCHVVGLAQDGTCTTDLDGTTELPPDADLILIGDTEAEERFLSRYVAQADRSWWSRLRAAFRG